MRDRVLTTKFSMGKPETLDYIFSDAIRCELPSCHFDTSADFLKPCPLDEASGTAYAGQVPRISYIMTHTFFMLVYFCDRLLLREIAWRAS